MDLLRRANVLRNYKLTWQPDASADIDRCEANAPFGKVTVIGSVDPIEGSNSKQVNRPRQAGKKTLTLSRVELTATRREQADWRFFWLDLR